MTEQDDKLKQRARELADVIITKYRAHNLCQLEEIIQCESFAALADVRREGALEEAKWWLVTGLIDDLCLVDDNCCICDKRREHVAALERGAEPSSEDIAYLDERVVRQGRLEEARYIAGADWDCLVINTDIEIVRAFFTKRIAELERGAERREVGRK